jgi:hypothetical protein
MQPPNQYWCIIPLRSAEKLKQKAYFYNTVEKKMKNLAKTNRKGVSTPSSMPPTPSILPSHSYAANPSISFVH